jgi:hypothetical protein
MTRFFFDQKEKKMLQEPYISIKENTAKKLNEIAQTLSMCDRPGVISSCAAELDQLAFMLMGIALEAKNAERKAA